MRIGLSIALLLTLAACDPYGSIQQTEDIEAFEQYLKDYPTSPNVVPAKARLEEIYLKKAREAKTLEAYDTYIQRWPAGVHKKKAMAERQDMLLAWAEEEHTPEAWQKFLDEYPRAERRVRATAKRGKKAAEYMPNLTIGDVSLKQVNLAEDPEGPMNGWGFSADFTNNGTETIRFLQVTVSFLDKEGQSLGTDKWPLVASQFPVPMEEEKKVPVKPGETRTWEWTSGDIPEGWANKVKLKPTSISFEKKEMRSDGGN